MACDSLYVAWLKVHYPYELYTVMLKLYDEKKNTEKIANIISEMKRYKGISLIPGRWGQDNRDWTADKEKRTISQSLSSVKYMNKQVPKDLYNLSRMEQIPAGIVFHKEKNELGLVFISEETIYVKPDSFTNILRGIQMNTCLDARQIKILIELGYFEAFGSSGKLMKVFEEFFEGKNKLTKGVRSFEARLAACGKLESSLENSTLPVQKILQSESENIGLCLSTDSSSPANLYFVQNIDSKWGTRIKLYSVQRGTTGTVRFKKADLERQPVKENTLLRIDFRKAPRYTYSNGESVRVPGEYDIWAKNYYTV